MFGLFGNNKEFVQDIQEDAKHFISKVVEAECIDVDKMVTDFKDNITGEHDSATSQKMADVLAKYYRNGIEDTLKALREYIYSNSK